jgi:hypothetical protein
MLRWAILAAAFMAASPVWAADFTYADPTPTADERRVAGYLDLQAGHSWFDDTNFGPYEASHYNATARINFWLGPRSSIQFDVWDEEIYFPDDDHERFYGGAAHLSWRDPSSHLLGVVASVGNAFHDSYANVAVEAQRYFGDLTLYGQAGYAWGFDDGAGQTMPYAHLVARYFCNHDLMLEGQAGYGRFEGNGAIDVVRWQAKIESKIPDVPLAGYIAYQGTYNKPERFGPVWEHTVLVGIKLLSSPTLQANDRNGATLADHNPLFGQPAWRL